MPNVLVAIVVALINDVMTHKMETFLKYEICTVQGYPLTLFLNLYLGTALVCTSSSCTYTNALTAICGCSAQVPGLMNIQ